MRSISIVCLLGLGALALWFGLGRSGPELVPVRGRVVYRDGSPVYPGSIWFIPDARQRTRSGAVVPSEGSGSVLDETGSFAIRTYPHGPGVPVGRYKATLSLGPGSSAELSKYAGTTTTPLLYEVPEGGLEDLEIQLDANPAPPGTAGPPNARGLPGGAR